MTQVLQLSHPIDVRGESMALITLRRPSVQEVRMIKALPYRVDDDQAVTLDLAIAARYIEICAGIPPSSVDQLDLYDLGAASWIVAGFFTSASSVLAR